MTVSDLGSFSKKRNIMKQIFFLPLLLMILSGGLFILFMHWSCIPNPTEDNNLLPSPNRIEVQSSNTTITLTINGNYNNDFYSHFGGYNIYYGHERNSAEERIIYIENNLPTYPANATSDGILKVDVILNDDIRYKYATNKEGPEELEIIGTYSNYFFVVKPVNNLNGLESFDGQIITELKTYQLALGTTLDISTSSNVQISLNDNPIEYAFIVDGENFQIYPTGELTSMSNTNSFLLLGYRENIFEVSEVPNDDYNTEVIPIKQNQLFIIQNGNDYAKIFIKNFTTEQIFLDVAYQRNSVLFR